MIHNLTYLELKNIITPTLIPLRSNSLAQIKTPKPVRKFDIPSLKPVQNPLRQVNVQQKNAFKGEDTKQKTNQISLQSFQKEPIQSRFNGLTPVVSTQKAAAIPIPTSQFIKKSFQPSSPTRVFNKTNSTISKIGNKQAEQNKFQEPSKPIKRDFYSSQIYLDKELLIQNQELRKQVKNYPTSANMQTLVEYLVQNSKSDLEKAWMLYLWVGSNIKYDDVAFAQNKIPNQDAEFIFQSRLSVCQGFSNLYLELGNLAGLKVRKVHGSSKGGPYYYGEIFRGIDHAWNIISIEGQEYLIDATWSNLESTGTDYQSMYFIADPEYFIYDHLPVKASDQLLKNTWNKAQFEGSSHINPSFTTFGFEFDQRKCGNFVSDSVVKIQLHRVNTNNPLADLHFMVQMKNFGNKKQIETLGIFRKEGGGSEYELLFDYPFQGEYLVNIYASQEKYASHKFIFETKITIRRNQNVYQPFGMAIDDIRENNLYGIKNLSHPFRNYQMKDRKIEMKFEKNINCLMFSTFQSNGTQEGTIKCNDRYSQNMQMLDQGTQSDIRLIYQFPSSVSKASIEIHFKNNLSDTWNTVMQYQISF